MNVYKYLEILGVIVSLVGACMGSVAVANNFLKKITAKNIENENIQKINQNIIIEQYVPNSMGDKEIELTNSYRLKQDTLDELSEKRSVDKFFKKLAFTLAVIMSVAGTIILFTGIVLSFFFETRIVWITTTSGVIIEIVAGLYFWLVNKTIKEVKENSQQLENTKNQITAMELVERIEDSKTKDSVYVEMIKALIEN